MRGAKLEVGIIGHAKYLIESNGIAISPVYKDTKFGDCLHGLVFNTGTVGIELCGLTTAEKLDLIAKKKQFEKLKADLAKTKQNVGK